MFIFMKFQRKAKVSLMLAKKAAIPWSSQVKNVVDEVLKFFSDKNSQAFKVNIFKFVFRTLKKYLSLSQLFFTLFNITK